MGDVFILVCNFHVPLALKVGCPSCGAGCDVALVFIHVTTKGKFQRVAQFSSNIALKL
jgi:hypothetical protein